jgi:diguanylate cyclase (GGDEF)-like protein
MIVLRKKIMYAFALLLLGGFVVTSLLSYFSARASLSDQISNQMLPLAADKLHAELLGELSTFVAVSRQMAVDTFVRDWMKSGENDAQQIEEYLRSVKMNNNAFTAYYISEKSRRYYHSSGEYRVIDENNEGDSWYFERKHSPRDYDIILSKDEMNKEEVIVFINYEVLDDQAAFVGIAGVGTRLTEIQQQLNNYHLQYGGRAYLVDQSGTVLFHDQSFGSMGSIHESIALSPIAEQILSPGSHSLHYREHGETILLNSLALGDFGWFLILESQADGANDSILKALVGNLVGAVFVTAITLCLLYFVFNGYQRKLENMATVDYLSKALNRSAFDVIFSQTLAMAKRKKSAPCSLVLFDIDKFKVVNDTYGHTAGDTVISRLADVVRSQIRQSDVFCRWGGDEFILLLPDCHAEKARDVAEKISQNINRENFDFCDGSVTVTLSAGVIDFSSYENKGVLISRVDEALYRAKKHGRNRIELARKKSG